MIVMMNLHFFLLLSPKSQAFEAVVHQQKQQIDKQTKDFQRWVKIHDRKKKDLRLCGS